jgi:hypothetical protein
VKWAELAFIQQVYLFNLLQLPRCHKVRENALNPFEDFVKIPKDRFFLFLITFPKKYLQALI